MKLEKNKFNLPVSSDDIDFRIQSINKGGYATILAYKDARYDMNVLDETVGPMNWQKRYTTIDGRLYCEVGVYDKETNQWIWKQDVGTESNTEQEKGQASDAFKRACFNWGIGRELYDFPLIQVKLNPDEFTIVGNKGKATFKLQLRKWTWGIKRDKDLNIIQLAAKDQNEKLRFNYKK